MDTERSAGVVSTITDEDWRKVPQYRYAVRDCMIIGKPVWTVQVKQADGAWRIVGCVDQQEGVCHGWPCTFTMAGGAWPFITWPSARAGAAHTDAPV